MDTTDPGAPASPPPRGVRLEWWQIPPEDRGDVERLLGSAVVDAKSQPTGFSPGVAARLRLADGRRLFAKAIGPVPNPKSVEIHRREAQVMSVMPMDAPVPPLLHSYDDRKSGWVVLIFQDIEGVHPQEPWQVDELDRVLQAMVALSDSLTPSPLSIEIARTAGEAFSTQLCGWQRLINEQSSRLDKLDDWSLHHIEALAELERTAVAAVAGETLLHFDLRADNMLLTPEHVWFVDWPHVCVGAAWIDVMFFAPSVAMQGGPPPEQLIARHPAYQVADPAAITAAIAAMAGFFTHRAVQPPPPGLPTVRAFQAAQGVIARRWVAQRTGWS